MIYQPRFHVVLHQPEIPPNTGAIGRTCVAMQAKLWLVRPLGFRIDEKTRRRAGLDYWDYLEWEVVDHWEALKQSLSDSRFWFFSKKSTRSFWSVEYQATDALVFGAETSGLPPSILEQHPDQAIQIPMHDNIRSLNLSCSVAIAGYELSRQIGAF